MVGKMMIFFVRICTRFKHVDLYLVTHRKLREKQQNNEKMMKENFLHKHAVC